MNETVDYTMQNLQEINSIKVRALQLMVTNGVRDWILPEAHTLRSE